MFLGAALIWALFLPVANDHGFTFDPRPPVALLIVLALIAFAGLAGWRLPGSVRGLLAVGLVVLAGLQIVNATVDRMLDRPLDLYFDLRHVPSLLGLYLGAAGWRGVAVIIGAGAALVIAIALVVMAVKAIEHATARPVVAMGWLAVAVLGLALTAAPVALVNSRAIGVAGQQASDAWRSFAVLHGVDRHYDAALQAPQKPLGPLPGLDGHDVYLVFIESYGTVVLDDPAYHATIAPALADFAATAEAAGYRLVSNRLVSPTYGGGSWLAHGTISSGLKLDLLLNELVLNSDRNSLPRYLKAAGYRTIEVMPGIKKPAPEAAFWGFDKSYDAAGLGYAGPEFGWFDVPDQYTLSQVSSHELTLGHPPLFAQIVLVSSHTPFAPVPPYLADWNDAGKFETAPMPDWTRIYAPPDWNNLDKPYLDSVAYDLKTLGAWLSRLDSNALVIILGDHQPPEITRGANQAWTVPVHVLSRDAALIRPFEADGYVAGDEPPASNAESMEKFLDMFLDGFGPCVRSPDDAAVVTRPACAMPTASARAEAPPQSLAAPALSQP
jgi:hypothetical protein